MIFSRWAVLCLAAGGPVLAAPASVTFSSAPGSIAVFDPVEITIQVAGPDAANPFVDAAVAGELRRRSGPAAAVEGFCDSSDGSVFKIRFMPIAEGRHEWTATYRQGSFTQTASGEFTAVKLKARGMAVVDPEHPYHFKWSGTGEPYFYNGTTAYWLLGWKDEAVIRASIDRLARLKVNRIRVALNGRTKDGGRWMEKAILPDEHFQFRLEPWPAARPADIENPGYDVSRFNLEHFQRFERMLAHARSKDMVVSVIFHLDGADKGVDPFGKEGMGNDDEQRYYRYAVARFAAYSNVMWDVTNEWHLFRDEAWVEKMGALIRRSDPYGHAMSVHGKGVFPFRASEWADYAMYQSWDEHGAYDFMLRNRREQEATGKPKPQVNEEYGYEDHYPYPWGEKRVYPARVADNRRRLAWEMVMAGGYQTTGERANIAGMGGWITGRGDDRMVLFNTQNYMVSFFTSVDWRAAEPQPELVTGGARCLAKPGELYLVYLPQGIPAKLKLAPGDYRVRAFDPKSGNWSELAPVQGGTWSVPGSSGGDDRAFVLTRSGQLKP